MVLLISSDFDLRFDHLGEISLFCFQTIFCFNVVNTLIKDEIEKPSRQKNLCLITLSDWTNDEMDFKTFGIA
jgi:hypothetical protein